MVIDDQGGGGSRFHCLVEGQSVTRRRVEIIISSQNEGIQSEVII